MTPKEGPEAGPRRRRSRLEFFIIASLALGLALFFVDYVLGGAQAAGYLWFKARTAALEFLAWRIQAYVFVLIPTVAVLAYFLRHALPIIEIPILGAGALEAHWVKVWYWPGSLHYEDDEATWQEGRRRAYINKAFLARRGFLGLGVTVPVERTQDDGHNEITYDTASIPAYRSRIQHRRLLEEIEEHVGRQHRMDQP
jgi:hypothetical protein